MVYLIISIVCVVSVLFQTMHSSALHGVTRGNLGIYGGHTVPIEAVPYMVALLKVKKNFVVRFCGGSIVHERFVLTAAHCFWSFHPSGITVMVGTDDWTKDSQTIRVEEQYCHKEYENYFPYSNDICLYKLENPVTLGPNVAIVKLPDEDFKLQAGTQASLYGWGTTEAGGLQQALLQTTMPITSDELCRRMYPFSSDDVFCAGSKGHGPCEGDSGSPVIYNGQQIGVASTVPARDGASQCGSKLGALFTKVSSYLQWINTTITENL